MFRARAADRADNVPLAGGQRLAGADLPFVMRSCPAAEVHWLDEQLNNTSEQQ